MALDRSPELCNVISKAKHINTIIPTKIVNNVSFIWPSDLFVLPYMTHIRTWTRYHQDKHSDKVSLLKVKMRPPDVLTLVSFNLA